MAFNGSGVFARLYNWVQDRDNSIKILAQKMDDETDGIATGLSTCITKDGQTTITANIPMATYKFTGLGAGSALTDSAQLGQAQNGAFKYDATDSGAADAYAIQLSPTVTAYAAGQTFRFVAANASTGASTIDVDGLGTKAIEYQGSALTGAEITAGSTIEVTYDGTAFQMTSPSGIGAQTQGAVLDDLNTLGAPTADGEFIVATGAGVFAYESGATARTSLGLAIGTDVQAYDADTLKADVDDTLTAGFAATADADGTKSSGTYTPTTAGGNFKTATNGGAHTLAPQSEVSTIIIQYTNNASAGAVTTSGWDAVTGDSFTTTDGDDFMCYLTVVGTFQHLHVAALQ
jgi:hypothetical protein